MMKVILTLRWRISKKWLEGLILHMLLLAMDSNSVMDLMLVVWYHYWCSTHNQLFIGHHGAYEYDPVWYTDDLGKSWTASNTYFKKMDEAQLVELGDGIVMANMRNQHLNVRES